MSADVQQAPALSSDKTDSRASKDPLHRRPSFHLIHKRHKEDIKQQCRKRSQRFCYHDKHVGGGPPVKRRKKDVLIPPTKFLLGGNIRDPLNLNSLRDEEVNRRLNAVTPETSPMPTPQWKKGEVEVLLPPNIHDPLNLEGPESPQMYVSTPSLKKSRKKNKKKKPRSSTEQPISSEEGPVEVATGTNRSEPSLNTSGSDCCGEENQSETVKEVEPQPGVSSETQEEEKEKPQPEVEVTEECTDRLEEPLPPPPVILPPPPPPPVPPNTLALPKPLDPACIKKGKGATSKKAVDKIVSPVVKQPGACGTSGPRRKPHPPLPLRLPSNMPTFKESNKKYQYGNYNRYYGYRNADYEMDPRLKLLELCRDLFEGKEVLDIGCNTGHITLAIASDMGASRVVGLDLDRRLVEAARANIKHYVRRGNTGQPYPASMPLLYGPLPENTKIPAQKTFPHNISFVQGNYVLPNDVLLDLETPQFDTILCLSVTKWFHLNWGDEGLTRAFRRMYAQLRPGGVLILEPQPWSSYKKKKNITETTWKNYQSISLFPQKFTQFLLGVVGFTKCEILGSPAHTSRGFERPIKIYTKGFESRGLDLLRMSEIAGDITSEPTNPAEVTKSSEDTRIQHDEENAPSTVKPDGIPSTSDTTQSGDNVEIG